VSNFAVMPGNYIPAAKANLEAYLQQLQSLRGISASNHEIADLYATSVFLYATTNFWADAVSGTDFVVSYKGVRVDPEHPLQKLLATNGDMYRRSEVARMMWGRNLVWKRRNLQGRIYDLRWINPTLYAVDAGSTGLRGFKVYPGRYAVNATNYIKTQDAIFTHEIDFDDDFDGIAAAEVAFLQAAAETELATTALAWFRNNMFMSGIFQPAEGTSADTKQVNGMIGLLKSMFQGAVNAGRSLVQNQRWEYIQLQQDFDKVALSSTYETIRQNISIATNVPVEFVTTGQANYAEIKGKIQLWYQLRLKPVVGRQADAYTMQLASEYGDGYTVEADITPLMISDPTEQADLVEKKLESMVIDLYGAQQELGVKAPDINLKGLYRVNGIPVPSENMREIWQYQLGSGAAIAKATPMYDVTALARTQAPILSPLKMVNNRQKPAIKADTPQSAYAYIPLANNADVLRLQRQLKERLPDTRIEWQIPATYHVTLCFADKVSDSAIDKISESIHFAAFEMEAVQGEELAYFDTPDGKALHIPILHTNLLNALQADVHRIFAATSEGLSEFSVPENYNPHITIAYLPDDIDFNFEDYRDIANPLSSVLLPVNQVIVSRSDYDPALIVSATQRIKSSPAFIPDDQYKELKDWQRLISRRGDDYAFAARALPEAAVKFITWGLSTDAALEDVFTAAEHLLRQSPDETYLTDSFDAVQRAEKSDAVKSIEDTRSRFVNTFAPILRELDAGTLTSARAQVLVHAQLERFERMAYLDGLISGGIPDAQMTLQDFRAMSSLTTKQKQFATQFINRALADGIGDVPSKAQQWFNGSVYPFYVEGQRNGVDNPNEIWDMDSAKENCASCLKLNGQIHRRSSWNEKGLYPNSNKLICGPGNDCGCTRNVTAEKARGRFLSANLVAAEHAH
jgi:phage portal protein BeeE/2'-5' RNA ligase